MQSSVCICNIIISIVTYYHQYIYRLFDLIIIIISSQHIYIYHLQAFAPSIYDCIICRYIHRYIYYIRGAESAASHGWKACCYRVNQTEALAARPGNPRLH